MAACVTRQSAAPAGSVWGIRSVEKRCTSRTQCTCTDAYKHLNATHASPSATRATDTPVECVGTVAQLRAGSDVAWLSSAGLYLPI